MTLRYVTCTADIKIWALVTVIAKPGLDFNTTNIAAMNKRWLRWIVEMIESHHGAVLRPAEEIVLVVIALAQFEVRLTCIEELASYCGIIRNRSGGCDGGKALSSVIERGVSLRYREGYLSVVTRIAQSVVHHCTFLRILHSLALEEDTIGYE